MLAQARKSARAGMLPDIGRQPRPARRAGDDRPPGPCQNGLCQNGPGRSLPLPPFRAFLPCLVLLPVRVFLPFRVLLPVREFLPFPAGGLPMRRSPPRRRARHRMRRR